MRRSAACTRRCRPCSLSYLPYSLPTDFLPTYFLPTYYLPTYFSPTYFSQAVLSQLDELRRVNRQLRMHALEFGWEWEPLTQSLVMARNRREVAASIDRQEKRSCSPKRNQRASSRQVRAADAPLTASDREEEAGEEGGAGGRDSGGEAWPEGTDTVGAACAARSASAGGRRRKRNN